MFSCDHFHVIHRWTLVFIQQFNHSFIHALALPTNWSSTEKDDAVNERNVDGVTCLLDSDWPWSDG